ncbi:hypothetical protein L204_102952 [Cryptococcus depauperatus]|nr:neutral amino acid transporter [Cryptococcus depauperatus CBS 7855]
MGAIIGMCSKKSTIVSSVGPTFLSNDSKSSSPSFDDPEHDPVFGEIKDGAVNYRSVGVVKATILMVKLAIALGVLAMPQVLLDVGGVPGVLIIVFFGLLTTWTGRVVGQFKTNHPEIYAMDGVGYVLAGWWGREFYSIIYSLFTIFCCSSGYITFSIAFNAITNHAACTVVWTVIAVVITFIFSSLQTLNRVSILGWVGFVSIMTSIFIITIAVGVQGRPEAAPATGPWDKGIAVARHHGTFLQGMSAVSTVVFSFCGITAFLNVMGEMRQPKRYNQALYSAQAICTFTYLTIGIVVYYFCGQYISNPALGSAGTIIKKVSYGVAIPGLLVGCILYTHMGAKMIFVRLLRGSEHLTSNSFIHWATWLGSVGACVIIAFILAESIPFFGEFISLVGASLGTFLCLVTVGWMWFYDNWNKRKTDKSLYYKLLVALNAFVIVSGIFIIVAGTWAAATSISNAYKNGAISSPFSCVNNSK